MLACGNLYFSNISKSDANMKEAYKFFYNALNVDKRNVYAANGLGMVCAEKQEYAAAKEIFARVFTFILPAT